MKVRKLKLHQLTDLPKVRLLNRSYLQLHNFITRHKHKTSFFRPLTEFEKLCFEQKPIRRGTSLAYNIIAQPLIGTVDKYKLIWETALGKKIPESDWEKACVFSHKCSISTKLQETSYKVRTQWYITPVKRKTWSDIHSDICWRCNKSVGTFLHIWWEFEEIQKFWTTITDLVIQITGTNLKLDAASCLLHLNDFSYKTYKKSPIRHMLNAAKSLIATNWHSTRIPSTQHWLRKIKNIYDMEETLAIKRENEASFLKIWYSWTVFTFSPEYKSLMDT